MSEKPTTTQDLTTLKQARAYLRNEIEHDRVTPGIWDEIEKLDDQIAALEYPDPAHPIHKIRELQKVRELIDDLRNDTNTVAKQNEYKVELDRIDKLIEQLSAPVAEPPALELDDQDEDEPDDDRVLTPDEVEIVQAMRRGDYNEAIRLSFKKVAEKPVTLTPDEYHHLTSYQIRRDKYQETHPGEFPDLVMRNRYDFDDIGPEYQMSLFIMSELAFAKMLPGNMVEGGQAGKDGKVFFDFFNALAGAVSDGLDKVDIAELTQHHGKE